MVATRADRRRFPAHWDESETCAVVEDSAVRCSSATDLPGATPMTAYHYRRHLAYPRSSSSSHHPKSSPRLRRLSRLQQRGVVSRGDVEQECRGRGDFLSGRQRQRLQSQPREDFAAAATSWTGWPCTTRSFSWWTGTTTAPPCHRRTSTARRPGCVPSLLLLVLLFLLQQPLLVLGSGVFELRLGSFSNPSNRDSHGSCCSTGLPPATEGTPCPGSPCRVSFRVCLKHYQKTVDTDSPCTYGELSTPVLVQSESDGAIFNASRPPIRFPFEFSWPGTFSLIIEAWHEGPAPAGGSASSGVHRTLVAQMSTQKWLDVGDSWTPGTLQKERAALSYSYRVRCQEYYYGSDCAKLCRPRDDKFGHYKCSASGDVVCLPGWKGDYCTKAICLKGCKEPQGDCDRPNECKCRIGWEGPLCDRCVRYPGCLHGTCSQPWQCNCDEGWGGLFCNQDLNYCTNNRPCRHGGTCTNTGQGSYTCSCLPGYAGTDCEVVQDPCLASPCQNGGICRATDASASSNHGYTCSCPPGLGGRHCEVPHSACDSNPCQNGGSCREAPDTSEGYRCLCPDAFAGDQCEVQRDPCEPSPCANGGTCVTLSDGNSRGDGGSEHRFRCECRPGFEGPLCQTNIDDCVSNPCLNGGTCLDGADSFRCLCRPGFLGQLCDHDVDDCLTYPCANGGRCVDLVNDFACNCPAGFSGKDCSVNLDECASSPCLNGGVCVDLAGRFECRCPDDFGGDRCEHRPPALAPRVAVVPPSPGRSSARRGGEDMGRHDLLTREDNRDRGYEEELSGVQLALIVTASVTVPLVALVAALVIVCQRRRWKERRDAEAARRQNERNAVQHQGMNNKGAGGKAPPPVVVVNALVEKPLQKKANGDNNASSSSSSTSAPPTTGTAKVLNVDARAQSKLSLDVDTAPEGVYASTRTLNRLYQEPGGGIEGGATVAAQHALERASLRGSSPKSCDSRVVDVVEDDIASIKQQLHQQPQPVTGGSNAVYVIEDHYRDENLLATEV